MGPSSVLESFAITMAAGLASTALATVVATPIAITGSNGSLGPGQGAATFVQPSTLAFTWQSQISNSGVVWFRGVSSAAGSATSGNGIWTRSGGSNAAAALAGTSSPGGGTFSASSYTLRLSSAGGAAFSHGTAGLVAGNSGASLGRVAAALDAAPGTSGATFLAASGLNGSIYQNNSGQTLYYGQLTVGTGSPAVTSSTNVANNTGLWMGTSGPSGLNTNAALVLRQNQEISSLVSRPSGATGTLHVGSISFGSTTSFNDNGKFATLAAIQSAGASDLVTNGTGNDNLNNNSLILSNRSGTLQAIARRGDRAPDSNGNLSGNSYGTISSTFVALNNNGRVAFQTRLTNIAGSTVTAVAAAALFSDHDNNTGTIKEVARASQAIPPVYSPTDTSHSSPLAKFAGRTFGGSFTTKINWDNSLYISASGFGGTGGSASSAIFRRDVSGFWTSLYAGGDVAIAGGASDGTDIKFSALSGGFALNAAGQVAFAVNLTGTGLSAGNRNNVALMATNLDSTLTMIARLGDYWDFDGNGVDYRQIVGINNVSGGPEDGSGCSFNANGDLVFELHFGDPNIGQPTPIVTSSGVYTVHIPSPATAASLGMAGLLAFRRRRTRR